MLDIIMKATVILVAAFAVSRLLGRSSAAARHLAWTMALAGVLVLPLAWLLMPAWRVAPISTQSAIAAVTASAVPVSSQAQPVARRAVDPLPALWLIGGLIMLVRLLAGSARVQRLARHATPCDTWRGLVAELSGNLGLRRPARILISDSVGQPMTFGTLRPIVLLPAAARSWSPEQARLVLLHELAHVERHDVAAQWTAQLACCVYWFHPLAWLAARRLRIERERACDDRVLALGARASDYATQLLESARWLSHRDESPLVAVAMARPSQLEGRLVAILDPSLPRHAAPRRTVAFAATLALALVFGLAALHPAAAQAPPAGRVSGRVLDISRATVPNAAVRLTAIPSGLVLTTDTNDPGDFTFVAVAPGDYELEVLAPGFAANKRRITLRTDAGVHEMIMLEPGSIRETVKVTAKRLGAAPVETAAAPTRTRVGGNMQPAKLVRQTKPLYPASAQTQGHQGTVVLSAVVFVDGSVGPNIKVVSAPTPELAAAAVDAVRQWRYEPTRLNGQPIETVNTITVLFQLEN